MDFTRLAEDDPNRCQGNNAHGQCRFRAVEGSKFCEQHGGAVALKTQRKNDIYRLKLGSLSERVQEFANNPDAITLYQELAVMRALLENLINRSADPEELFVNTPQIAELVTKVEKIVISCQRLERVAGALLSKTAVYSIADNLLTIISNYIEPEVLKEIGDQFALTIETEAEREAERRLEAASDS